MDDYKDLFTAPDHEEGAEVRLHDMKGKATDMYLMIKGVDSKSWRKEKHAIEQTAMLIRSMPEAERTKIDPDDATASALANCVISWRGFKSKGKDVEFSTEKVKQLFLNAPYIMERVDGFFSKRVNFTKGKVTG